jgi:3-mercaptopyruvate sulfurtransferase SseA
MTVTFQNDNDIIVYALEKVIAYARDTQRIFVAQCVWWLLSIIGLEQGLINYIYNLKQGSDITRIEEERRTVKRTSPSQDRKTKSCHMP